MAIERSGMLRERVSTCASLGVANEYGATVGAFHYPYGE